VGCGSRAPERLELTLRIGFVAHAALHRITVLRGQRLRGSASCLDVEPRELLRGGGALGLTVPPSPLSRADEVIG
jgi:hypothetical protein